MTEGKAILLYLFLLPVFLMSTCFSLQAALSIEEIPYGISYPSQMFHTDDFIEFPVWAGSAAEPLSDIVGFDLIFKLTDHAEFPTSLEPDFSSSWLGQEEDLTITVTLDSVAKTIRIVAQRDEGAKDGYGELMTFTLVSDSDSVKAEELLLSSGGGIIITIDDIILRQASSPDMEQAELEIYPNPSKGRLNLPWETQDIQTISLFDNSGRQIALPRQSLIDLRKWNLPAGRYWVEIRLVSGRIIRNPLLLLQ